MVNVKNNNIPTIIIFICWIMVIIGPKIGFADFSFIPIFGVAFFLIFIEAINNKKVNLRLPYEAYIIVFVWLVMFCLAMFSFIYHGSVATQALLKPLRQILLITILCILFSRCHFKQEQILSLIVYASSINASVVLIQYISGLMIPGNAGDFLMNPGFDEEINMVWRKPGLFSGYPHAAVLSAFGSVVSMLLIANTGKYRYYLTFLLAFVTLFITSRTGLMLGLLGVFFLLPYLISSSKKNFILVILFSVFVSGLFIVVVTRNVLANDTIPMMLEVFINLAQGNGATSASQSALYESFSYDINYVSTLLFGNGLEHHADNGLNVDAGFQQTLFSSGVFGLIFTHLIFLLMMLRMIYTPFSGWRLNISTGVILFLFLCVFVSNLKAGFMFSRGPGDVIIILYCFKLVSDKKMK